MSLYRADLRFEQKIQFHHLLLARKFRGTRLLFSAACLLPMMLLSACRSDHIEINLQNHTGAPIHLLEVDYPSASFGVQDLAAGATYHYRIQVQGNGPVNVSYSTPGNTQPHIAGPQLADRQQGSLAIDLLPNGKANFQLQIQPH